MGEKAGTLSGYSSRPNIFSQKGSIMRVGVMVGSRFGRVVPERVVRGEAEKVDVAKKKLVKREGLAVKPVPKKKRVKKSDG